MPAARPHHALDEARNLGAHNLSVYGLDDLQRVTAFGHLYNVEPYVFECYRALIAVSWRACYRVLVDGCTNCSKQTDVSQSCAKSKC